MKICFVSHRITNPITGGEIYNDALIDSAKLAGFQVENWEGIAWDRIKNVVLRIIWMNLLYLFKTMFLHKGNIIILDTDFHARSIFALLLARIKGIKVIGLVHHYSFLFDKGPFANFVHYNLEKFVTNRFDYMIINSSFSYRVFIDLCHKKIPYTILSPFTQTQKAPAQKVKFNPETLCLIQVGTLEDRKNVINVIKAVSPLKIDYRLNFVGHCYSEQYLSKINSLIDYYSLHGKIILHGKVSNELLHQLYLESSAFVLVSKLEGYGIVYTEAMQYGLPIIGSTIGAVPDLVEDGVNGFLCDPHNPAQITEAILKLTDKNTWNRIHYNNLEKAQTFMDKNSFIECGRTIFNNLRDFNFLG